jgi:hypothetical protein
VIQVADQCHVAVPLGDRLFVHARTG